MRIWQLSISSRGATISISYLVSRFIIGRKKREDNNDPQS